MTYFPDLAPYAYGIHPQGWGTEGPPSLDPSELYVWTWSPSEGAFALPELTVGWLQPPHSYPRGEMVGSLVEKLISLCRASRYHATRGFHPCGFCGDWKDGFGSKEIRIHGDGVVYAAPDKIAHYVSVHNYLPPKQFVAALQKCDGLALPTPNVSRHVSVEMIPREEVNVARLETEIRNSLQRNHRDEVFLGMSITDGGETVEVFSRVELHDRPDPCGRTWKVPKAALLNMTQSVYCIIGMLERVHSEISFALMAERRRSRG